MQFNAAYRLPLNQKPYAKFTRKEKQCVKTMLKLPLLRDEIPDKNSTERELTRY